MQCSATCALMMHRQQACIEQLYKVRMKSVWLTAADDCRAAQVHACMQRRMQACASAPHACARPTCVSACRETLLSPVGDSSVCRRGGERGRESQGRMAGSHNVNRMGRPYRCATTCMVGTHVQAGVGARMGRTGAPADLSTNQRTVRAAAPASPPGARPAPWPARAGHGSAAPGPACTSASIFARADGVGSRCALCVGKHRHDWQAHDKSCCDAYLEVGEGHQQALPALLQPHQPGLQARTERPHEIGIGAGRRVGPHRNRGMPPGPTFSPHMLSSTPRTARPRLLNALTLAAVPPTESG